MWNEVDVARRLQDGMCAWDHRATRSLRRNSPQASRSRHCRAGSPILSLLIPGCSVAGDQDPSRFPVRARGLGPGGPRVAVTMFGHRFGHAHLPM
jgi:hypothetical protein